MNGRGVGEQEELELSGEREKIREQFRDSWCLSEKSEN